MGFTYVAAVFLLTGSQHTSPSQLSCLRLYKRDVCSILWNHAYFSNWMLMCEHSVTQMYNSTTGVLFLKWCNLLPSCWFQHQDLRNCFFTSEILKNSFAKSLRPITFFKPWFLQYLRNILSLSLFVGLFNCWLAYS